MKNKNKLLLVSLILGVAYIVYSAMYWTSANTGAGTDTAALGSAFATALVMPHLIVVFIAVVFNLLAFFMSKAGFALVAGILYAVGMLLFPMYFFFVVVQMILCFVAYAKMHKKIAE